MSQADRILCPKCGSDALRVTNTYGVSQGSFQKRVCENCEVVIVTQVVIVCVDPTFGNGAYSLAKKAKEKARQEAGSEKTTKTDAIKKRS